MSVVLSVYLTVCIAYIRMGSYFHIRWGPKLTRTSLEMIRILIWIPEIYLVFLTIFGFRSGQGFCSIRHCWFLFIHVFCTLAPEVSDYQIKKKIFFC